MRLLRWLRPAKVEPIPIEGLSRESQAILLSGLKAQVRELDKRIDQVEADIRTANHRASESRTHMKNAEQWASDSAGDRRRLVEQRDALQRTINDMGGRS